MVGSWISNFRFSMEDEALIQNFKAFCNEVYKFPQEEREKIFKLVDNMSNISSINNTNETLKELCKQVFNILCDHDLWRVFLRILKNKKKYVDFRLIVTDGHYFFNRSDATISSE